jgi:hypothetical protein
MKALSVRQPWASLIASGTKTIETRTWNTKFRGDILIVASKNPKVKNLPTGVALAIVSIVDCKPMTIHDVPAARCELYPGAFSWFIENIRPVKPFEVKGQLGIYEVELPENNKI